MGVTAQDARLARMDSVEFGLITCSPHNEVYSLYGHSALHLHDLTTGEHRVYNYGIFDFHKPHFVWRFMMGQTDYRLESTDRFNGFCAYYANWGSQVEEQVLNLTAAEKLRLLDALDENLKNPVYRYNFFYDNCSTRPRDIIERCTGGAIVYADEGDDAPTYRQLIHECARQHPWAAFGNDLLLGFRADRKTTQRECEFLPARLSHDFDRAYILRDGARHPLVLRRVIHVPQGAQPVEKEFPLSPRACTFILLIATLLICIHERRKGRIAVWWDALLMLTSGVAGCILALMFFSEHPATSTNLQILILNPLSLLFIPSVLRRRPTRWFRISLVCIAAFLVGSFWQDYAEGMETVALCLLLRYWIHRHEQ